VINVREFRRCFGSLIDLKRECGVELRMSLKSVLGVVALCLLPVRLMAQPPGFGATADPSLRDSDGDGLSDSLEQALLVQFEPELLIARHDCSGFPSEFRPDVAEPEPAAENGTLYGQVFPAKAAAGQAKKMTGQVVEIHYYHLWRRDCGAHGHWLDAEHVSALVQATGSEPMGWKAIYWYAAAHENTVCDVSQISRASTLGAEDHGAKVWISPGKHASYLNETLCERGCGADHCQAMVPLERGEPAKVVNLGEPGHPMNGSEFVASNSWPLLEKMKTSNFPVDAVARLEGLPDTDIAWFNAGRHPMQQVIAVSDSTEGAIARSGSNTGTAINVATGSTGDAISTAGSSTGNALQKSYRRTAHALGKSARKVGEALGDSPKAATSKAPQ
jgi:hypothetical protein